MTHLQKAFVCLIMSVTQSLLAGVALAEQNPFKVYDRYSRYAFSGTPAEAKALAEEINRIGRFQKSSLEFPGSAHRNDVFPEDLLSKRTLISGDMLNVARSHGQLAINPKSLSVAKTGVAPTLALGSLNVVDPRKYYHFSGTAAEAERYLKNYDAYRKRFGGAGKLVGSDMTVAKLMSGEQLIPGAHVNAMKQSGFLKVGGKAFKRIPVVAIVGGMMVAVPAAQAATVRGNMQPGEDSDSANESNVGGATDFGSFPEQPKARFSKTVR